MNIPATPIEGLGAVRPPCTLQLLISALGFVLAASKLAPTPAIVPIAGVAVMAWAQFTGVWRSEVSAVAVVLAGLEVGSAATAWSRPRLRSRSTVVAAAAVGGSMAMALSRRTLGRIIMINRSPDHRLRSLTATIAQISPSVTTPHRR